MFGACSALCLCSKQEKVNGAVITPNQVPGGTESQASDAGKTPAAAAGADLEDDGGDGEGRRRHRLTVNTRDAGSSGTAEPALASPGGGEDGDEEAKLGKSSPGREKGKKNKRISAVAGSINGVEGRIVDVPEMTPEEASHSKASTSCNLPSPEELVNEVTRPSQIFDLVSHQFCCFGSTLDGKGGQARIEPEFTEKELEVSGAIDAGEIRQKLAKIGIGICCKKGKKPEQPNQDNVFFNKFGNFTICGVADGHGPDGHWASHWAARFMLRLLTPEVNAAKAAPGDEALARIFDLTHRALVIRSKMDKFDLSMSGTTMSVCVINHQDRHVVAAWVGDSRCAVSRCDGLGLSSDHKPQDREERQRIVGHGGEVVRLDGDVPHRVFVKGGDVPGLAMSRAIGDCVAHTVGVTHKPGIVRMPLQDHVVLCCSDGVWEFIQSAQACKMVSQFGGRDKVADAAHLLTKESRNRWLKEEEYLTDDISAIVIYL